MQGFVRSFESLQAWKCDTFILVQSWTIDNAQERWAIRGIVHHSLDQKSCAETWSSLVTKLFTHPNSKAAVTDLPDSTLNVGGASELGTFRKFETTVNLTLTLYLGKGHTIVNYSSTSTKILCHLYRKIYMNGLPSPTLLGHVSGMISVSLKIKKSVPLWTWNKDTQISFAIHLVTKPNPSITAGKHRVDLQKWRASNFTGNK